MRKCRRVPRGGEVEVARRDERAHFSGLTTCGSVWACPICSERIMAERAQELGTAVKGHYDGGGAVVFLTLTMRHNASQRLSDLWDAAADAWAAASGNRSVRAEKAAAGMVGWVRRTETTYGSNGWHVHVHAFLFLRSPDRHQQLGDAMFAAWAKRLEGHGLSAVKDSGGYDCKLLDLNAASEVVTDYLVKSHYDGLTTAERAARELTSAGSKQARGRGRTPFQILADVVDDATPRDVALWHEWEQSSRGRRAITWSQGFREQLRLQRERSDEEIAQDSDAEAVPVAAIPVATWDKLYAIPDGPLLVLEAAESVPIPQAMAAITAQLAALGLPPPRPPTVGGSP